MSKKFSSKKNIKKGFGLIELSLMISAISASTAGSLSITGSQMTNSRIKLTNERINASYKAIGIYLLNKKRLPCPASLLETKSSPSYGLSAYVASEKKEDISWYKQNRGGNNNNDDDNKDHENNRNEDDGGNSYSYGHSDDCRGNGNDDKDYENNRNEDNNGNAYAYAYGHDKEHCRNKNPVLSIKCDADGIYKSNAIENGQNLVYGMVPVKTLGLSAEMAEDGFGGKIVYVLDQRFANPFFLRDSKGSYSLSDLDIYGAINFATMDSSTNALTPILKSKSRIADSDIENKTDLVLGLISYGINQFGSFKANSSAFPTNRDVASDDEKKNIPTNFDTTNRVANISLPMIARSSNSFDDLTLFKSRNEIIRDFNVASLTICKNLYIPGLSFPKTNAVFGEIIYANSSNIGPRNGACESSSLRKKAARCGNFSDLNGIGKFFELPCPVVGFCEPLNGMSNSPLGLLVGTFGKDIPCDSGYYGTFSYSCSAAFPPVLTITSGGCDLIRCPVSIAGVLMGTFPNPDFIGSGRGTLLCNAPNYSGSVEYFCPSQSEASSANPEIIVTGSCSSVCLVNVEGVLQKTVSDGSGTLNCDAPNYKGSVNYSCSAPSENVVINGQACQGTCNLMTRGYVGVVDVSDSNVSVPCNLGYSGTVTYKCQTPGDTPTVINNGCISN